MSKSCWKCGAGFSCGADSGAGCWCEKYPPLAPSGHADCLCPDCLGRAIAEQPKRVLIEGDDYYLEGALVVFTAAYHLRRGYCCGSGCRHCPYRD